MGYIALRTETANSRSNDRTGDPAGWMAWRGDRCMALGRDWRCARSLLGRLAHHRPPIQIGSCCSTNLVMRKLGNIAQASRPGCKFAGTAEVTRRRLDLGNLVWTCAWRSMSKGTCDRLAILVILRSAKLAISLSCTHLPRDPLVLVHANDRPEKHWGGQKAR